MTDFNHKEKNNFFFNILWSKLSINYINFISFIRGYPEFGRHFLFFFFRHFGGMLTGKIMNKKKKYFMVKFPLGQVKRALKKKRRENLNSKQKKKKNTNSMSF